MPVLKILKNNKNKKLKILKIEITNNYDFSFLFYFFLMIILNIFNLKKKLFIKNIKMLIMEDI